MSTLLVLFLSDSLEITWVSLTPLSDRSPLNDLSSRNVTLQTTLTLSPPYHPDSVVVVPVRDSYLPGRMSVPQRSRRGGPRRSGESPWEPSDRFLVTPKSLRGREGSRHLTLLLVEDPTPKTYMRRLLRDGTGVPSPTPPGEMGHGAGPGFRLELPGGRTEEQPGPRVGTSVLSATPLR